MNYENFKKINERAVQMNEMALSSMQIAKIKSLSEAGELKKSLKLIMSKLDSIINDILSLGYKDIDSVVERTKNVDYVEIIYSELIKHELDLLRNIILKHDFLYNEIFKGGDTKFTIDAEVHKDNLNKD